MSKKLTKLLALLLACMMCATLFAGCKKTETENEQPGDTTTEPANDTPLVVAYSPFSEKFSPFFADTQYDVDAVNMTQISMLTTDRMGGIIYNAIDGEKVNYNGTDYEYKGPCNVTVSYDQSADVTTYTVKLKEGIKFSDGTEATADDMLFTYYVYLDPDYVGSTTLNSYDIIGLRNYQTQTTDDIYDKYNSMFADIYAAGANYTVKGGESFTQEQYDLFWKTLLPEAWKSQIQGLVDYVYNNYFGDYWESQMPGLTYSDNLKVAFAMVMWGFGTLENNVLTATDTSKTWDLTAAYPSIDDLYDECVAKYKGDPEAYFNTEATGEESTSILAAAQTNFISQAGSADPGMSGGIKSVSGITKVDNYTIEVKTNGYSAPAVYSICGLNITPMHYYGDEKQWDPDNGLYGHPFGDLSIVRGNTTTPMGAGAYKFVKYENKVIYYEANENYWRGTPKIKYIQFKETASAEVASAVASGTVDAGEMTGSKDRFNEVKSFNSNAEISGDVITTSKVDNLGYGYIGINASLVKVGDDSASDQSKDLRKAIATLYSVYRNTVVDSYYGELASVVNYPISNTSWAAPRVSDDGYQIAYSVDVDGKPIYTDSMTDDERYAAALAAAVGYLKAAGYTFDDASGKFTAAPAGASLTYSVIIPGDGQGNHPSYGILTNAKEALASIGLTLEINDPSDSNQLWTALDANTAEMWCAAWQATPDPDMYQVYHSDNVTGSGTNSNHYYIQDADLDSLIMEARTSADQSFRKATYKECLDIILDWAVEIPVYQRKNAVIFSTERVNIDTLTPDITTFWGWMNDLETLEMK